MMQTFGVAPWYGLFKWVGPLTNTLKQSDCVAIDKSGRITSAGGGCVSVSNIGRWQSPSGESGVVEDKCLFWRPYEGKVSKYSDPTGGKQKTVKYWCDAVGVAYDPKTGYCKK